MEASPKSNYETRVTQMTVLPTNEPIFSERATAIAIEDEAAGEYVTITQHHEGEGAKILIEEGDWPLIRQAVNSMLVEIKEREERKLA